MSSSRQVVAPSRTVWPEVALTGAESGYAEHAWHAWLGWRLPLLAATLVTLFYLWPQLVYTGHGHSGALLVQEDEAMYVSRMVRAAQGLPVFSPLIYEHRHATSGLISGFAESAMALPFRGLIALGLPSLPTINFMVVFYRALLAFVGVLALTFAFVSSGISRPIAALVSFWCFVDGGVMPYKPLLGLLWTVNVYDRLTNPLVGLPIFCLGWGAMARAMLHDERRYTWAAISGIAIGLSFYVNFYYWTNLVAIAGLTALLDVRKRAPLVIVMLGIGALISVRYWPYALEFRQHPLYMDILWRTDFRRHGRGVTFMPNKTMLPMLLAAASAWYVVGTRHARFLVVSLAAGVVLFYSGLITGLEMPSSTESVHWNYGISPLVMAACLWSALHWLERSRWARYKDRLLLTLSVVLLVGGASTFVRLAHFDEVPHQGAGTLDAAYAPAWQWLREHTPSEVVVLASEETMADALLRSGKYVWIHSHTYPDPISFEETFARYRVLWALEGTGPDALERYFPQVFPGADTWMWMWGLPQELAEQLRADDWPQLEAMRWRSFAGATRDVVARATPQEIKTLGQQYRVDYVVRGPLERSWPELGAWLETQPVFEHTGVRIDKVVRWR